MFLKFFKVVLKFFKVVLKVFFLICFKVVLKKKLKKPTYHPVLSPWKVKYFPRELFSACLTASVKTSEMSGKIFDSFKQKIWD